MLKLIRLTAFFLFSASTIPPALSAVITNYAQLQAAIGATDPNLTITVPQIDWPANSPLSINYNATFTAASPSGTVILSGQNVSDLFQLAQTTSFAGNFVMSGGKGLVNRGDILIIASANATINGSPTFTGNNTSGKAGAIDITTSASLTINGNPTFSNNTAALTGGAILLFTGSPTLTINGNPVFMTNRAVGNGGAIQMESAGSILTFNGSPTFIGNSGSSGGAIFATSSTINIRTTNPAVPALFQGNTPQDILLNGTSQLNLNTDAGTLIDMQSGVASSNALATISKIGLGTWQMGGNSSGYQGTTNVTGGTFQVQPGAVYGTTTARPVTIGPAGALVFNVGTGGPLPLLQAATINLDGTVSVVGTPTTDLEGVVAQAANPILINGVPAVANSVLNYGMLGTATWQLAFISPTQLELVIAQANDLIIGDQNDQNLGGALSRFNLRANPGLLAQYILAIQRAEGEEAHYLLDALQGEVLTGSYEQLLLQLITFNEQVDERLNTPGATAEKMALDTKRRIRLASVDKSLPLTYSSAPTPWVGWGQAIGGMGRQNSVQGSNAYDSRTAGITTGFDRALDQSWRLGGALTLQRGVLDWDKYDAQTRSSTLGAVFYGSYDHDTWFARSLVGGGGSWVNNQRELPLTPLGLVGTPPTLTATSNTTLPFINARVSTGFHTYYNKVRFTPSAGLFYVHTISDPYAESGADQLNLQVDQSDQDNLEAQVNLETLYVTKVNDRPVTLRANYGLGYETLDKQVTITTGFLAFPELNTFNASAVSPGRLRQIAEVGMNVEVAKNVWFRLDYMGLFARHQYNNIGALGVKVMF